jgi:hypothetical protein
MSNIMGSCRKGAVRTKISSHVIYETLKGESEDSCIQEGLKGFFAASKSESLNFWIVAPKDPF